LGDWKVDDIVYLWDVEPHFNHLLIGIGLVGHVVGDHFAFHIVMDCALVGEGQTFKVFFYLFETGYDHKAIYVVPPQIFFYVYYLAVPHDWISAL
jgi:hypothetical protein